MFILPLLALATLSCSAEEEGYKWRDDWKEEGGSEEPVEVVEPNPSVTALGWSNVSADYGPLPEGIQVYRSPETLAGVDAIAYIAVADLSKIGWDVWSIDDPKTQGTTDALKTPGDVYSATAAPIVINGGYFFTEGGKNYNASVAVSGGRVYGVNLNYASVDWETYYYPTRAVFYEKDGALSAGWTYYASANSHYLYDAPAMNSWSQDPLQAPDANFPVKATDFAAETAIGAGPVLIHGGEAVNSWEAELFYGDGSDNKMPEARHPRTAIGTTGSSLILFVCEGRGMTDGIAGLTTGEVATALKALGCTEAINLDGGGSSCLLVNGMETIKVSDGSQRRVGSAVILKAK